MTAENNGNIGAILKTSSSNEDLSEYTDADESISAPTEFLAEFLSAVMLKDYVTALKYCKLILQYEPNNATAKEFYPLILEKLKKELEPPAAEDNSSSNDSGDEECDDNSSSSESGSSGQDDSSEGQEEEEDEEDEEEVEQVHGDKRSKGSSDGATTGSYSSLEDDDDAVDQLAALAAKYHNDNINLGNGNTIYSTSTPMSTSNYKPKSSSLFEVDNKPTSLPNQGNFQVMASSDSESPTDPISQQTVAMLRARVVPNV